MKSGLWWICGGLSLVYGVMGGYIPVWFVDGLACVVCRFEGLSLQGGEFVGVVES
jgi:hypothetical protein